MFEHSSPTDLISTIESTQRQESMNMARQNAAIAALLNHRIAEALEDDPDPGYAMISGFTRTTAEVSAAMNISPMAASRVVSNAETLDTRLPRVAAQLAEGRTDWRTVQLIIARTALVSDNLIAELDVTLANRIGNWQCWSRRRIVNAVDAAVRTVDPDAARERRVKADTDRHIGITPLPDGMAQIRGSITSTAAAAFDRRLSELATDVCPNDSRTMAQRRADAIAALSEGRSLECACEIPDCPSRDAEPDHEPGGVRTVLNVVASERTVHGESNQPGYLEGYGVIDADQVRELAASASLRLLENPPVSDAEALRYQPSAAVERAIRCRDLTCRFPGCDRPASFCDIDHTVPFNHADPAKGGLTVPWNLKCLCRLHHRLKTFLGGSGGWRDKQLPDGTVIWTSPTGRTYRTTPSGPELFPEMRTPACATPKPRRRNRSRDRARRIAMARERNRIQRPINAVQRQLNRARKREIDHRKYRNHMRTMLAIFKPGQRSTSPYATWVNEPFESEELPPDWRPPPEPPLPDDPPF